MTKSVNPVGEIRLINASISKMETCGVLHVSLLVRELELVIHKLTNYINDSTHHNVVMACCNRPVTYFNRTINTLRKYKN